MGSDARFFLASTSSLQNNTTTDNLYSPYNGSAVTETQVCWTSLQKFTWPACRMAATAIYQSYCQHLTSAANPLAATVDEWNGWTFDCFMMLCKPHNKTTIQSAIAATADLT